MISIVGKANGGQWENIVRNKKKQIRQERIKIMGKTGGWKLQDCLELQRGQVLQRIKKIEIVGKRLVVRLIIRKNQSNEDKMNQKFYRQDNE